MHAESSLDLVSTPAPTNSYAPPHVEQLADAIATLAARLHAATYELLVLIRRFDDAGGWSGGFVSCAHWLHWRTGIDLGAAREKVRVAKALATLPLISQAMETGRLSYAKVRALTRVATPDEEVRLLEFAHCATAAQVERLVRAWRRVDRVAEAADTERRHLQRELRMWVDDDGMVVIRGRLTPELGAVVRRAIDAAADRLWRDAEPTTTSVTAATAGQEAGTLAQEVSYAQRRADALGLIAESALAAGLDPGTTADRYQVVLHVDAGLDSGLDAGGAIEDDPPLRVSAETSRRLACDASVVTMPHDTYGTPLEAGRKTRTIPPATRRALTARDHHCRFPGCTSRYVDAHHLHHWADGGPTSLENLVLLCRRHHRAVHEEGWTVLLAADGRVRVWRPNGTELLAVPPPVLPGGFTPEATGLPDVPHPPVPLHVPPYERMDVGYVVDVLHPRARVKLVG